jgi:hypothetical protein
MRVAIYTRVSTPDGKAIPEDATPGASRQWPSPVAVGRGAAPLPGSISFVACVCDTKSGPTSTRRFCHSAVHSFAGSSCERRGRRAERVSAFCLVPVQTRGGQVVSGN